MKTSEQFEKLLNLKTVSLVDLRVADALVRDSSVHVLEDRRVEDNFILAKCPYDDGRLDHACFIVNPHLGKPGRIFCDSEPCRKTSTEDFLLRYFSKSSLKSMDTSVRDWIMNLLNPSL